MNHGVMGILGWDEQTRAQCDGPRAGVLGSPCLPMLAYRPCQHPAVVPGEGKRAKSLLETPRTPTGSSPLAPIPLWAPVLSGTPGATTLPCPPLHWTPRSCSPHQDPVLAMVPGDVGPAGRDRV